MPNPFFFGGKIIHISCTHLACPTLAQFQEILERHLALWAHHPQPELSC